MVPRSSHRGIVFLAKLSKATELSSALSAMARLRIDPEEITFEPLLLLLCTPGEFLITPFTLEPGIHVPVTRTHAVVLFLSIRPHSRGVVNRQCSEEKMPGHSRRIGIPENVHGVIAGQSQDRFQWNVRARSYDVSKEVSLVVDAGGS